MYLFRRATISLACTLVATAAMANDIGYYETVQNTDFAEFGIGRLRGVGSGTISVSGVSGSVTQALLYWHGPTNSIDPTANASVMFGGSSIFGTGIGFSSDNAWGFQNSQAYRADVTSLVTGNGSYSLSNFLKPGIAEINGASLLVFYSDGSTTNNRDIVLFDGNDSNNTNPYDAFGWNTSLSGINYSGGSAAVTMTVSDGQTFSDDALKINGNTIAGPGAVFDGTINQISTGGVSNGALWDVKSFDVTSFLSNGLNALSVTTGVSSDYLSLIALAIDLPAGAAPPPPLNPIPEPETYALMLAGLSTLGFVRRRRKASFKESSDQR